MNSKISLTFDINKHNLSNLNNCNIITANNNIPIFTYFSNINHHQFDYDNKIKIIEHLLIIYYYL